MGPLTPPLVAGPGGGDEERGEMTGMAEHRAAVGPWGIAWFQAYCSCGWNGKHWTDLGMAIQERQEHERLAAQEGTAP